MKEEQKQPQQERGIADRNIVQEMKESYLDYAMSVIVARALPDVRDGLKPVHRRILYTMHEMGLSASSKHRKSAAIVGDALGKYHPHGDSAVYDSLARMAQDFSLRYPLVDGQGNFGSIDGDAPAAMRYTEARMTKITAEMLRDIEKDTVDFTDNYDGTRKEPKVLPASIPQLLLNGSLGIAVGMATNIPPHNLREVIDATIHLIEKPKATIEDLGNLVKGPDFPTGGLIFNEQDILQAYATGRGGIVTRGEAEIVEKKQGQFQIIVTSIPYQVSKADLITKIADLVRDKKIDGIKDVRDESDKDGLTIAIDLGRDAFPQKVLNALYKHTDLEKAFHFNMVGLVDGIQPQLLSLKSLLEYFIAHRKDVVERRTKFELARAEERAHILEGLKKALDHIDAIIQTIKKSPDKDVAHERLMKKFKLSDRQATAILEMRLQTLAGLERQKIEDELKEKQKLIKHLRALLKDPQKMLSVIKEELIAIKEKYGDERKTKIVTHAVKSFSAEDLIPNKASFTILTKGGYIKRVDPQEYRGQKRGGKGISAMSMKEEDIIDTVLSGNTHDDLFFFTNTGKVYKTKAYEIPEGKRTTKGKSAVNFLALTPTEYITSMISVAKDEKHKNFSLLMVTENGIIKKVESAHFDDVRRSGIIALKLQKNDTLRWVRLAQKNDHIILATRKGISVRFKESDVRPMGRTAAGVRAIRLHQSDALVGADILSSGEKSASLFVISEKGYGKKTPVQDYRIQKRGGSGIKTMNITPKTGPLMDAKIITEQTELVAISKKGQIIRTEVKQVPELGRSTQGVRLMKLDANDSIASITLL
ncbi:MAG: DNA gyrase subunit A [Candidatus Niyogibacteria bacterium CG10_big_fil_rev_8_21_14_0_10_46_36]|uniref:DNA gyrase subunit A n=1 Tax=Candidatus Niyogibacteria bacterium CG10_big_fil_rev_8_21_14_0_10_46_36 TaxID=1974726 RepID=A0A2H0TDE5_9BACT|nr:MAG: DNA gyrase subunit A [Candidatus Niyogibacteria bacterium CG10_big_fil_rev_8_21_14_0_10_46_36]